MTPTRPPPTPPATILPSETCRGVVVAVVMSTAGVDTSVVASLLGPPVVAVVRSTAGVDTSVVASVLGPPVVTVVASIVGPLVVTVVTSAAGVDTSVFSCVDVVGSLGIMVESGSK